MVSFDMTSLFTSVQIDKALDIVKQKLEWDPILLDGVFLQYLCNSYM